MEAAAPRVAGMSDASTLIKEQRDAGGGVNAKITTAQGTYCLRRRPGEFNMSDRLIDRNVVPTNCP